MTLDGTLEGYLKRAAGMHGAYAAPKVQLDRG